MKRSFLKKAVLALLLVGCIVPIAALAQENPAGYQPLAPIPLGPLNSENLDMSAYVRGMFQLLIGITVVLSVLFIIFGGFQYITTDTFSGKSEGRQTIDNAVWGLMLAIVSWIILYTINPALVEFNFNPTDETKIATSSPGGLVPVTQITSPCESSNCVDLRVMGIAVKPGQSSQVIPELGRKLLALNSSLGAQGVTWWVTEGWPPTGYSVRNPKGIHQSSCHALATCIDANLTTAVTPENIEKFISAAASNGLRAVYEVTNYERFNELVKAGVPSSSIDVYTHITGEHFSVYNK